MIEKVRSVTPTLFIGIYSMSNVKGIGKKTNIINIADKLDDKGELFDMILKEGIISESDALRAEEMRKRDYIKKHHKYAITHHEGKDSRWFTYLPEKNGRGRKRFARTSEKDLIDYLYHFYKEMYEPYLIYIDFIQRTPRGRIATVKAIDYVLNNSK